MQYMKEKLGAWQIGTDPKSGKARFRVFFPKESSGLQHNIKSIQVCGSFQMALEQTDWTPHPANVMTKLPHSEGEIWEWETPKELPCGFYEYKYYVTFNDNTHPNPPLVSDPCTRYGGKDNMNAAFVIGGSQPNDNVITPLKGGRKPLRDLVMYELMIDDFTSEFRGLRAPLDAVKDKLDDLLACGFNAILFMPWTAWNDNKFSWGYTPALYYSVEYRYANDLNHPEEKLSWLKQLIHECHKRGIHVIMDGVFNHVSPSFPYKFFYQSEDKDCPYTGQFYGQFSGLQDLDFHNACTQEFIFDVCRYWIEEFKIDGIRFDNTVNFYNRGDNKGLPELLKDIENLGESHFSLTLEHLQMDAVEVTKSTPANSYWDNALYGECFGGLWDGDIKPSLLNALNNNRYLQGTGKVPTIYLGNHDHADVAWQAGARNNAGALEWYRSQPYVIAMLTSPGAVLIKNGQEFAEDYWIPEDDKGSSRRVQSRPLHWDYPNDKVIGKPLRAVYTKIIKLRHAYEVLRGDGFYPDYWEDWQTRFNPVGVGIDTARHLLVYRRYCVDSQNKLHHAVIVLNFSGNDQWMDLTFPEDGQWLDLLSEPQWMITVTNRSYHLQINSNWGRIFYKQ
jgi:glycosidase